MAIRGLAEPEARGALKNEIDGHNKDFERFLNYANMIMPGRAAFEDTATPATPESSSVTYDKTPQGLAVDGLKGRLGKR